MNIRTRNLFAGFTLALFGAWNATALAQDAPPPPERPAQPERPALPEQPERPQLPEQPERPELPERAELPESPERADAEAPTVEAEDADTATTADDDAPIEWTRDSPRSMRGARRHSGNDIFSFGGNSQLRAGETADAVVSLFGTTTTAGEVRHAAVAIFGSTRVEGGSVGEASVAIMGDNYVNAEVNGDVVAIFGDVELGPKADVRGNVVVIGGVLRRDPLARVSGGVQNVMSLPPEALSGFRAWVDHCLRYLRPLAFAPGLGWAWTIALGFLALYAALALILRDPVDQCVKTLQQQPGKTVLASLLGVLLTPVLFMVMAITVVGIAFIPVASFAIFIATLFGKAVVLAWIGRGVLKLADQEERLHTAVAVLTGGVLVLLLYVVPVLGFLMFKLLGMLAFGVVLYTLLLAAQARKRAATPPAGPAVAGGPSPGNGPGLGGPRYSPDAYSTAGATFTTAGPPGATATFTAPGSAFTAPGAAFTAPDAAFTAPDAANVGTSNTVGAEASMPPGAQFAEVSGVEPSAAADAVSSTSAAGAAGGVGAGGAGAGAQFTGGSAGRAYAGPPPLNIAALPRAGFWIRMLALFIDATIIGVGTALLVNDGQLFLVALAAYGAIMWKTKGTTVGGIVCNLRVVRLDNQPIDWSTAVVRALACFLSLIFIGLGFIWIAFDEGRQAWHDKIANTAVVRVPQGASLV